MKNVIFIQKQGFIRNEFVLSDKSLTINQSNLLEHKSYVILLENLGHRITKKKESPVLIKGIAVYLLLCSLLVVVGMAYTHSKHMSAWLWISLSLVNAWLALMMLLTPAENELMLTNGREQFVMLTNRPSEKEVNEFINEVIARSRSVILQKYGTIDPDLPEKLMISQLDRLLRIGVIDEDEFHKRKEQYFNERLR